MEQAQLDMKVLRTLQTVALRVVQTILLAVLALLVKVVMEEMDTSPARTLSSGQLHTTEEVEVGLAKEDVIWIQINIRRVPEEMVMVAMVWNGMVLFMQAVAVLAFIQEATQVRVAVALAAEAVVVK